MPKGSDWDWGDNLVAPLIFTHASVGSSDEMDHFDLNSADAASCSVESRCVNKRVRCPRIGRF